jgi:ribose transport system substrate-binding protein
MQERLRRLLFTGAATTTLLGLTVVNPTASLAASRGQAAKTYTIYLSNNFLGNDWRVLMENLARVLSAKPPLAGRVDLKIENTAENTASAQIQQLQEIIAQRPSAIVLDSASPTALNPVVQSACKAGIVVVSFDQVITAPCAWKAHVNSYQEGVYDAEWMARTLHGKGDIYDDIGIAGTPIAQEFDSAYSKVFKHYPGIKVVCQMATNAALGTEESAVSNCLSAHPTVNGIISLGFGTGAMKVLKQAGHVPVPIAAASYNATMLACASKSQPCFVVSDPPWLGGYAVKLAVSVLDHKLSGKPQDIYVSTPYYENNGVAIPGLKTTNIVVGQNAYSSLPGGTFLPISPPWTTVTPREALSGKV